MLNPIRILSIALLSAAAGGATLAAADSQRPNLIFILADDLGYGEVGCYGQKVIQTPEIDRMASEGMRFTQFYAGATVCAPSRSVLMTGQHQGHTRVRDNRGRVPLAAEDVTVAEVLQQAGYRTALIGKWGLGDVGDEAESGLPRRQGFDYFYGYLDQGHAHNRFPDFLWRNEERVPLPNDIVPTGKSGAGYATRPVVYADDRFAEESLKFVAENKDRPFFLYLSMIAPHANDERHRALDDGAEVPNYGIYTDREWPNPDKGQAATITRMDEMVGRLLDALRNLGIADNTLVIFTSDNGPHKEDGHNLARFQPSGPLRGIKRDLTEGGIREPFIAWWPGHIHAGAESGHVGYLGDWMATAAQLAGAPVPAGCDSISIVPTLFGRDADQQKHEVLYWCFYPRGLTQALLYQGHWKGIRSSPDAPLELYDLANDIGEAHNVAALHPDLVKKIEALIHREHVPDPVWDTPRANAGQPEPQS